MSAWPSWIVGLVLFAIGGCAARPARLPEGPVTAIEITENGNALNIPALGVTDIDENSIVRLTVDKGRAQAALAAAVQVDAKEIDRLSNDIRKLNNAIASQQRALTALTTAIESPPRTEEAAAKAMAKVGPLERTASDDLKPFLTAAQDEEILSRGVGASFSAAIEVLARRSDDDQKSLDAIMKSLERVRWRMQGAIYTRSGRQDIHLDGYDSLDPGEPNVISKLAMPTNLLATIDQAKSAASNIGNLETALGRARRVLEEKADDFRDRLLKVAEVFEALPAIADRARKAPWTTLAQGKAIAGTMAQIASEAKAITTPCSDAFAMVRSLRGAALLGVLSSVPPSLEKCLGAVAKNAPNIATKSATLRDQIKAMRAAAIADAKTAKLVAQETTKDLEALASDLESSAVKEFSAWWDTVKEPFAKSGPIGSGPVLMSAEHAVDRAYRDVSDTTIDLVRTPRAAGDVVYYRAAVVTEGHETQQWTSPPMRVVVTGLHLDVSASVVFVRAVKTQTSDSAFPAAPAATAALHYGSRRGDNQNSGSGIWNFVNPGIGLHVAYLDLGPKVPAGSTTPPSDPSTEIGVGGTLQFFGDVVQAGVAYDLQVQRPYWFFGVGLQTATNFGLTVPASGGH